MNEELKEKYKLLSELMFKEIDKTVQDLENMYPERESNGNITRFAPSPTGFLHIGGLFGAMVDKKLAHDTDGIFILRIEDTDRKREVKGSVKLFTDELSKYGLAPDEGVVAEDKEIGNYGPYTQSKREEIYKICAKHLVQKGLAYPCFCTTEMLAKTHEMQEANKIQTGYYGVYAKCRNLSIDEYIERVKSGESFIVRFRSNGSHLNKMFFIDEARGRIDMAQNDQDDVIIKADGLPTYHFAHVVDDHFMRVTHVVRGEEWLPSTPKHLELFEAMGFEKPQYIHTPNMMKNDNGNKRKLSKRKDKEAAVEYYLKSGYPPEAVMEYIMTIANSDYEMWKSSNKGCTYKDFKFRVNKMSSSGALLDMFKLNDVCKEYIATLNSKELYEKAISWAKEYDENTYNIITRDKEYTLKMLAIERDNAKKIRKDLSKYEDIVKTFEYFFNDEFKKNLNETGYQFALTEKITKEVISNIIEEYLKVYSYSDDKDTWFNKVKQVSEKLGFCTDMKEYKINKDRYIGSTADVAGAIRVAITNRQNTPDIYAIMQVLGEETVNSRLKEVQNKI